MGNSPYSYRMPNDVREMLNQLADQYDLPASQVVNVAIDHFYNTHIKPESKREANPNRLLRKFD